jgi:RND superfamily putative drug exporter
VTATEQMLISARSGRLDTAAGMAAGHDVAKRMQAVGGIAHVSDPILAADRGAVLVVVDLKQDQVAAKQDLAPPLHQILAALAVVAGPDRGIARLSDP